MACSTIMCFPLQQPKHQHPTTYPGKAGLGEVLNAVGGMSLASEAVTSSSSGSEGRSPALCKSLPVGWSVGADWAPDCRGYPLAGSSTSCLVTRRALKMPGDLRGICSWCCLKTLGDGALHYAWEMLITPFLHSEC